MYLHFLNKKSYNFWFTEAHKLRKLKGKIKYRAERRRIRKVKFNQLLQANLTSPLDLFGAIEMARCIAAEETIPADLFLHPRAEQLIKASKVDLSKDNLIEILDKIQDYFDTVYRIHVYIDGFGAISYYTGKNNKQPSNIFIYIDEDGLYAVQDINLLFTDDYHIFCYICSGTCDIGVFHNINCPLRCHFCCFISNQGDCAPGESVFCPACSITFPSQQCYENHLIKYSKDGRSVCEIKKKCLLCNVEEIHRSKYKVHVCGVKAIQEKENP